MVVSFRRTNVNMGVFPLVLCVCAWIITICPVIEIGIDFANFHSSTIGMHVVAGVFGGPASRNTAYTGTIIIAHPPTNERRPGSLANTADHTQQYTVVRAIPFASVTCCISRTSNAMSVSCHAFTGCSPAVRSVCWL